MTARNRLRTLGQFLRSCPSEAYFWIIALVGVASIDPEGPPLLNLCLFEHLGFPCPGDGLGQSIAYLVRGHFEASWAAHPLGGPVVGILVYHVGGLIHSAQTRTQGRP